MSEVTQNQNIASQQFVTPAPPGGNGATPQFNNLSPAPNFNPPVQTPQAPNFNPPVQFQHEPAPVYQQPVFKSETQNSAQSQVTNEQPVKQETVQQVMQFTPDQFLQIIEKLSLGNSDFIQKMGDLVDGLKPAQRTFGIRKAKYAEEIDNSDMLDKPAVFFAWGLMTNIRDDIKNGQPVKTPYGRPIRFKNLYRYKRGSGRDAEIVMICHAVVRSKKEAEFVRNHSKFNLRFFEVTAQAERMSSEYSVILSSVATEISKISQFEVMQRARVMGIPVTENFNVMKRTIIEKEAQRRFQNRMKYNRMPEPVDINNPTVVAQTPEEINKIKMVSE